VKRDDRIAGAAGLAGALAVGIEALSFRVDFLTDPLGPKALPLFAAALLGAGSLVVLARPEANPGWPAAGGRTRLAAAVASFLAYAALLFPLGFFLATGLEGVVLSRLFGGKLTHSALAGVAISAALFVVFGWALGIALPMGAVWQRFGG